MSSQKSLQASVLLICLMLPPLLCTNLRCYYSPYTTNETENLFKLVETECPPKRVCYTARGHYGEQVALTHHGCMLREDCDSFKMIRLKGVTYNTSYSCCDVSYCNAGTGVAANFATMFIVVGSLFLVMGL